MRPLMLVITLAAFIVVTQYALAIHHVNQAVFIRVVGGRNWLGDLPDHDLDNSVTKYLLDPENFLSPHMAYGTIGKKWLSRKRTDSLLG